MSYCDRSMSVVRRAASTICFNLMASLPIHLGQIIRNLIRSIRATCRSKIAKIVSIGNPMAAILKIYFDRLNDSKLGKKYREVRGVGGRGGGLLNKKNS